MKYLVLILLVFFSCNSNTETNKSPTVLPYEVETVARFMDTVAKYKTESLATKDNKPINYLTIDSLDIMTTDLGFFNVKQAEIECEKLVDGWRLPNEAELNLIYEKNEELGEFKSNHYVGMDSGLDAEDENVTVYLRISIMNGEIVTLQTNEEVYSVYGVRAVRNHKN
jgi:hypothetical protein